MNENADLGTWTINEHGEGAWSGIDLNNRDVMAVLVESLVDDLIAEEAKKRRRYYRMFGCVLNRWPWTMWNYKEIEAGADTPHLVYGRAPILGT